jgi:thioredoxin-like negative regulator of GroEL
MGVLIRRCAIAAAIVLCAGRPGAAGFAAMRWQTFEEGLASAPRTNRPMLLDFWADWCAPCKVMDADVYTKDEVVQAAEPFVAVRIDYDRKPALARRYHVSNIPTIVVTDSYGSELFRFTGYIDAAAFREMLQSLPRDVSEFNRLTRVLERDRNDFAALGELAGKLRSAGLFRTSNAYYARALECREAKADAVAREAILTASSANYLDVKDGRRAAADLERCLKEFPRSAREAEWTLNLGRAYLLDGKKEKARARLQEVVRRHPGTPEAAQAATLLAAS